MVLFAQIFTGLAIAIGIFQLALAFGAPWGEFTMGGRFPGKLPLKMRIAALFQILILFLFTSIVLSKAGLAFGFLYDIARVGIWFVFAFFILGTIVNLTSKSKKERYLMGPLNIVALVSVFMVALQ